MRFSTWSAIATAAFLAVSFSCVNACLRGFDQIGIPGRVDSNVNASTPLLEVPCGTIASTRQGRWFYIDTSSFNVSTRLYLTTCGWKTSIDTAMMIYSSNSSLCSESTMPVCTGTVIDSKNPTCDSTNFVTATGRFYWVYVYTPTGQYGDFTLRVSTTAFPVCFDKATSIESVSPATQMTSSTVFPAMSANTGSTLSSRPFPTCANIADQANGNWYSYVGTGWPVTFQTCSSSIATDVEVHVYRPSSAELSECGLFVCTERFSTPSPSLCDNVTIPTTLGDLVYFYVTATGSSSVSYTWGWRQPPRPAAPTLPAPVTPSCAFRWYAIASNGDSYIHSLASAPEAGLSAVPCNVRANIRGLWYSVTGLIPGTTYRASTCSQATTADTLISVFRSESRCIFCDCIRCHSVNDVSSSCSLSRRIVTFTPTLASDTYYFFVGSIVPTATYEFSLVVDNATSSSISSSSSLGSGAVAGIVIGVIIGLGLLVLIALLAISAPMRARLSGMFLRRSEPNTVVIQQPVLVPAPQPVMTQTTVTYTGPAHADMTHTMHQPIQMTNSMYA